LGFAATSKGEAENMFDEVEIINEDSWCAPIRAIGLRKF
jgi:hypothetical protein